MSRAVELVNGMSKFHPLNTCLCYDDFDHGHNGWVELLFNHTKPNGLPHDSVIDMSHWGPVMLSTNSYGYVGTHGSMNGTYSLKLATRPLSAPCDQPPAAGSMAHALKRLSDRKKGPKQIEMWFAYTPEQDRYGIGEKDIRSFGAFFDTQDDHCRYFIGVRYLNSVEGKLTKRWQYFQSSDVSDEQWGHGNAGWFKRGVDPQWFGRRYADGSGDGFKFIPDGHQELCYNESDDKINWLYFRLQIDTAKREYVELQCGDKVFDMRGIKPTFVEPYAGIRGLLNPTVFIETDTDRRVFLYLDSVVISAE